MTTIPSIDTRSVLAYVDSVAEKIDDPSVVAVPDKPAAEAFDASMNRSAADASLLRDVLTTLSLETPAPVSIPGGPVTILLEMPASPDDMPVAIPVAVPDKPSVARETPAAAPVAVVVDKPVTVDVPVAAPVAVAVDKPVAAEAPRATPVAVAVDKPVAVEAPVAVVVDKPVAVDAPVAAPVAVVVDKPVAVDAPVAAPVAVVVDKPVAVDAPVAAPVAVAVDKPVAVEAPAATPVAVVIDKPVAAEAPVAAPVVDGKAVVATPIPSAEDDTTVQPNAEAVIAAGYTPAVAVSDVPKAQSAAPAVVEAVQRPETIAAVTRGEVLVAAAQAVADAILVSPGLLRGEGEVRVQLRPDVLDGSVVTLNVTGRQLAVTFFPQNGDIAALIEQCRPQLEQHLVTKIHAFRISVNVKKDIRVRT